MTFSLRFGISLLLVTPFSINAEELNPQCEMISQLTATYYEHRTNGSSKQEVIEKYRPQVGNEAFVRTADLAINMAYSLPENQTKEEVVDLIYQQCLKYQ